MGILDLSYNEISFSIFWALLCKSTQTVGDTKPFIQKRYIRFLFATQNSGTISAF